MRGAGQGQGGVGRQRGGGDGDGVRYQAAALAETFHVARPPRARHPVPGGQLGHRVQQRDRLEQGDAAVGGEDGFGDGEADEAERERLVSAFQAC